ncbi:hypothetical protein SM14BL09_11890 [Serratia marcescens]|nr:hypothetical protein SM14BL09_11890 [Serratia marcescens]
MTKITEIERWEDEVHLIARSERVAGGRDGAVNKQAGQLANRTLHLKREVSAVSDLALADMGVYASATDAQNAINAGVEKRRFFPVKGNGNIWAWRYENVDGAATRTHDYLRNGKSILHIEQWLGVRLYDQTGETNNYFVRATGPDSGKIQTSPGTAVACFPVYAGQTYNVTAADYRSDYFAITLKTDSSLTGDTLGLVSITDNGDRKSFTVPPDSPAKFAFINTVIPNGQFDIRDNLSVEVDQINQVNGIPIVDAWARESLIESSLAFVEEDGGQLYAPENDQVNYFVRALGADAGKIQTSPGAMLTYFPVTPGKKYTVYASDFTPNFFVVALKTDSALTGSSLGLIELENSGSYRSFSVPADSPARFAFMNVVLPLQKWDIRAGLTVTGPALKAKSINGHEVYDAKARDMIASLGESSILTGKEAVYFGDSITAQNPRTKKNYHEYIAEAVGGMQIRNYGISGSGFYNRYADAATIKENPDYVVIFLGTNDFGEVGGRKPLGALFDEGTATVSGCINRLLRDIITKFYDKKIAILTPIPRLTSYGSNASNNASGFTLEQLAELIQQYAAHYSIPCLDLYHESNLPVYIPAGNAHYFTQPGGTQPDGLHPNDAGHQVMARKIRVFMESL